MQIADKQIFIQEFFQFSNPKPLETQFTQEELKNNDLKISLQIATRSNLRMQSDPKTNLVSFSCKNYGKNCFEIFAVKKEGFYQIQTDYLKQTHQRQCELKHQLFQYLKIYNLMKLKKNLIESQMIKKDLLKASPSQILSSISQEGQYFFQKKINYNPQMRRKLRKRFDNIINIDIKKITKGGRQENNEFIQNKIFKEKKNVNCSNQKLKYIESDEDDSTSFFDEKGTKYRKSKHLKKNDKFKKSAKITRKLRSNKEKQNIMMNNSELSSKKQIQKIQDEIYINPASVSQLKEIKLLNQQFNGYEDIFSWQSNEVYQPIYPSQTINDKLRQSVFLSLRNSMLKKSIQTQSLSNFPENIGNLNDFNEQEEMI